MIEITTQEELDSLKRIEEGERVAIRTPLRLNGVLEVFGFLRVEASLDCSYQEGRYIKARGSSRVVARNSSRVVAWDSSRVEAWDSSSVEAWGSSSPSRG